MSETKFDPFFEVKQVEAIEKLLPENGELPPMSYHEFVNKIREIIVQLER